MLTKFATILSVAAAATCAVVALPVPTGVWPTSTGTVFSDQVIVVPAGTAFDGKMQTYERSDITCQEQLESTWKDGMFYVEAGATLKNVIVGKNQMEGVHCDKHDCVIENVWWDDVCEDALSIKGGNASSVSRILGGGARFAEDKIMQHNGFGTVIIYGFYAQDFGKLYRSCGTCGAKQRHVQVSNVLAINPNASIVTVNWNNNDTAILKNIFIESANETATVCGKTTTATSPDLEPTPVGEGADGTVCIYSESDIHIKKTSVPTQPPVGGEGDATPAPRPSGCISGDA